MSRLAREALLADLSLDVVVDSTGSAEAGAAVGARCLRAGQHLVMVKVEADAPTPQGESFPLGDPTGRAEPLARGGLQAWVPQERGLGTASPDKASDPCGDGVNAPRGPGAPAPGNTL
jgi:hypothetical protein